MAETLGVKGLKSTLVLLAVLLGLGGYIYSTWNEDSAVSEENRVFASLDADDVQSVTVRSESGETTTVERSGDSWQITSPITAPASTTEASGLASTLSALDRVRTIEEAPSNLAEFGLAPPRVTVEFKGQSQSGGLLIGNKTSTGQNLYAKRSDSDAVFLIAAYQESSLNRSSFDLRDKALFNFESAQVETVEVSRDGSSLTLRKQGENWRLIAPVDARADLGLVEGLVGSVAGAQMRSVAAEDATPEQLKTWGFTGSSLSIAFTHGGNQTTLLIGNPVDESAVYAKDASRPLVVTIDKTIADSVARPAVEYRRRDVFGFRAYTVSRIEFTRADGTTTFERVPGATETDPDTWRRTAPTAADVDRQQMEGLLTGLADMRMVTFVDSTNNTGLDNPLLTVTATFGDDNTTETVRFGRQGTTAYVARTDEPGAAQIEADKLDEAIKALDGLAQ